MGAASQKQKEKDNDYENTRTDDGDKAVRDRRPSLIAWQVRDGKDDSKAFGIASASPGEPRRRLHRPAPRHTARRANRADEARATQRSSTGAGFARPLHLKGIRLCFTTTMNHFPITILSQLIAAMSTPVATQHLTQCTTISNANSPSVACTTAMRTEATMKLTIIDIAYHRNGICGAPFAAVLFETAAAKAAARSPSCSRRHTTVPSSTSPSSPLAT